MLAPRVFVSPYMVLFIILGACLCTAQEARTAQPPRYVLETSGQPHRTTAIAGTMIGPIVCDGNGGIYVRSTLPRTNLLASPVTRIRDDKVTLYDFSSIPEVQSSRVDAFTYTAESNGRVHLVAKYSAGKSLEQFLVSFSPDGRFSGKVPLNPSLAISQLVALPAGGYYMAGVRHRKGEKEDVKTVAASSFTSIFSSEGKLIKEIRSAQDDRDVRMEGEPPILVNTAIQFGQALLGPDGYIYVLQPGAETRVQVLSEAGEIQHEFKPWPPFLNADATMLYVAPSRFFVVFQPPESQTAHDECSVGDVRRCNWEAAGGL